MEPLVLAIDAGTTGITALAVNREARIVATGYREFTQHFPGDGRVEHELGDMWSAVCAAVEEVLGQVDRRSITALGLTNQRETLCLWDRETLGATRNAIVWQDRRSAGICQSLREGGHEPAITAQTGLRLDPYFTATKATWIAQNEPHTWASVESGRTAVGTVDSYLLARMTRGLEHITDATNASRTLLYDLLSGSWSDELCSMFSVPTDSLPAIVSSYGYLASTEPSVFCGLDVPICSIAGDQQAALAGQAGFAAGSAKCTYGTGSFLLIHTGDAPVFSSHGLLSTVALQHPDGSRTFALEGSVFVTGSAVQWLRDGLGIIETSAQVEQLALSVPDSGGVIFVPALTGLGAPDWDPHARGLLIGLTRGTTRGHIARATLESIAYQVRDVVDVMSGDSHLHLEALAIDGGAAANDLLCQMQADQLQIPVDRSAELQTTGLGAALLAGVGVGLWTDMSEIGSMRRSSGRFEPGARDGNGHARWRRAVERAKDWAV